MIIKCEQFANDNDSHLATIKYIGDNVIYHPKIKLCFYQPQLSNAQFCGILTNRNQILFGIDMRIWVLRE